MPIFDFTCKDCGKKFDLIISNNDKKKVKCPDCGSSEIIQLLSLFNTGGSSRENCTIGCQFAGSGG